jgi:hypothetical protein
VRSVLDRVTAARGWDGAGAVLVGAWEQLVIDSPSVQLWVPHPDHGAPVVEGLFSQRLDGGGSAFVGARPSELPASWQARLADEASRLMVLLQHLGYFGRCSLDAIIAGPDLDGACLHWVDCNARWGGVSTALTVANRLVGGHPYSMVVVQDHALPVPPRPFGMALEAVHDQLHRPGGPPSGVVLLTPSWTRTGVGIDLLAIGADAQTVGAIAHRAVDQLRQPQGADDRPVTLSCVPSARGRRTMTCPSSRRAGIVGGADAPMPSGVETNAVIADRTPLPRPLDHEL